MPNIHKLNNGLTVITDYIDTVETVSVGMWNKVGARNEQEEVNGVAHLLEPGEQQCRRCHLHQRQCQGLSVSDRAAMSSGLRETLR